MGMTDIWDTVLDHREKMSKTGLLKEKHKKQAVGWMWALVEEGLVSRFQAHKG